MNKQYKPRVFIGSSSESVSYAYDVQELLEKDAQVTVWNQGIFEVSKYSLEGLIEALDKSDYGIFIFAPDDFSEIRGVEYITVRDNTIFELGFFIGKLGKDRSFIIMPNEPKNIRIPTDLLGITIATFDPERDDYYKKAALGPACHKIRERLKQYPKPKITNNNILYPEETPRSTFTEFLLKGLGDRNVSKITLVTYTGEVDGSLFTKYRIEGCKKIEIYKRSILEDLFEQQAWNMKLLAKNEIVRYWDKKRNSIDVSHKLSDTKLPSIEINQYLYLQIPTKRLYILNDNEAILAYYEIVQKPSNEGGSIYKGITGSPAIKINKTTALGNFILDEVKNFIIGLKNNSRSWEEEKSILFNRANWKGLGNRPCINPRAVFFDVDGVLLNSLPNYFEAWHEAFKMVGVDFSEMETYLEEGRSGRDTIIKKLQDVNYSQISEEIIERIRIKKNEEYSKKKPKIQKGAKELIRKVAESSLDIWIVTGSSFDELGNILKTEFKDFIDVNKIISSKQASAGKPNPDPYLLACAKAKIHPHEGIAIENSPLGAISASTAGLFCICVNTGILNDVILEEAGARAVFKDCPDLAKKWQQVLSILKM
jgi:beta-phosphoglucomutase-like phosphatase (HAD superfamily)